MRLRIFTEPQQGADYATLLKVASATEELGFDAFSGQIITWPWATDPACPARRTPG